MACPSAPCCLCSRSSSRVCLKCAWFGFTLIAGGDFEQREAPIAAATDEVQLPASEAMDEGKENNGAHAAAGEAEDAD